MQNMENYEICFNCSGIFLKHELYRDWDSYCAGLFPVDKKNERMHNLSLFIERETLWRCLACRMIIGSNLIGRKLETIDENKVFLDEPSDN